MENPEGLIATHREIILLEQKAPSKRYQDIQSYMNDYLMASDQLEEQALPKDIKATTSVKQDLACQGYIQAPRFVTHTLLNSIHRRLSLLRLLLSRLRLLLLFCFACALPPRPPMMAAPSVPTPGPIKTSPRTAPVPAPRNVSLEA